MGSGRFARISAEFGWGGAWPHRFAANGILDKKGTLCSSER